jgi:DNA-directed RNA polymerase specialized sigma24 family protein
MKEKTLARNYTAIREDYRFDASIFNEDPRRVAVVKYIIEKRLKETDRILILLYIDCKSYRKLGERMNLSHATVGHEVQRIKRFILDEYGRLKDNYKIV